MAKNNPKPNTTPTKAGAPKKILIVDDHPMMREGLRAVIEQEPDLTVCGVAENARQAMEAVPKLAPDLALVDITLPKKSGLELVKDLKVMHPGLAILAISMHHQAPAAGGTGQSHPAGIAAADLRQQRDFRETPVALLRTTAEITDAHGYPHRPRI